MTSKENNSENPYNRNLGLDSLLQDLENSDIFDFSLNHMSSSTKPGDKSGKGNDKNCNTQWEQYENPGAAFLGPQLWEKTIPCDTTLKLECVDFDELLNDSELDEDVGGRNAAEASALPSPGSSSSTPNSPADTATSPSSVNAPITDSSQSQTTRSPTATHGGSPLSLPPESPEGQEFDPRTHAFSEDELRPQPVVKKSQKQYTPSELKDDRYWARRRKNNLAAKRSRDARRMKENQIALRASYLEKENGNLKTELEKTQALLKTLKKRLSAYETVD